MRRNVTVLFFFVLFSLSFSEVFAQAYALWPNSPGDPKSLAPTISGNVQASAMTYTSNLVSYTSYSTGTKNVASYLGLLASYTTSWGTSWSSTGAGAVYEQYSISPASGYNLNMTGVELYLGCSNTSGAMKVQLAYSTDGTNFTTFASNSAVNATITAAGGGQNGLYLSATGGMTTGASTSAFSSRINYWSTSFNSATLSVPNGGTFFLRVYPYNTIATLSNWLAVANVKIKGNASSAGSISSNPTNYNFGNVAAGSTSAAQSFTISASGLSSSISVAAPSGFQVSSDGITYGSSATIASTGGTLYVEFAPSSGTGGTGSVNVTLSSGSTSANVAVQGFAYSAEPTSQSTIGFGAVDGSSIVVNLSAVGNGSNHLIVIKSGSAVSWTPTDLTDYTAGTSSVFGTATDQGSGNKVVYNGTGSTVTVTGLTAGTTYYFAVYDFNVGSSGTQNYLTTSPGTGSQATASTPTLTLSKSSLAFGNAVVNSTSSEQTFTVSGTYLTGIPGNIAVAAPSGFEVSLSSGSGFASSINVPYTSSTLTATTVYVHFVPTAVTSYSGNVACTGGGTTEQDVAVTGSGIAVPAPTSLAVAQTSDNIVHLTWTAPANTYQNVLIFARAAGDITHTPSGSGSTYNNANSVMTSAGVYSTDNYLVYSGTGTSVEITGLTAGTTYYFNAYAYEGNAWSSAAASVNTTSNVRDVTGLTGTGGNAQVSLSWTNPAYYNTQSNYWDEVLIAARITSANDGTPAGDGSSYSSGAVAFGSGTAFGSGYIVYRGTASSTSITGLANDSSYYFKVFVRHGSVWSAGTEISKMAVPYATGDFGSVGSTDWGTYATAWKKWDGSSWGTAATAAPTSNDNVWIVGGKTITLPSSGTLNCKDLHVINGQLCKSTTPSSASSPRYLLLYGTTLEVGSLGILGNTAAGDSADGISFDIENDTLTVTGSGGTCSINRLRSNIASTHLIIDRDVTLNYHGSSNAGNAFAYYTVAGDNDTLTINAGKTLTFAPWACYNGVSTSHGLATTSQIFNINGTLTFQPGRPAGNTATPGWGYSNYFDLGTTSGKTCTVNIGATGVLNVTKLYPNGSKTDFSAGSGALININNNGVINVSDTADFRNASQFISGSGTVNLNGPVLIGSTSGITASAATGPVQTSTRTYNASRYEYVGAAGQVTGDGLPASVSALTVNNASGVTLSNSLTVNGTLTVSSGDLITGANTVSLGGSATLSETLGSEVLGNVTITRTLASGVNNTFGGIGIEVNAAGVAPGATSVTRVTGTALSGNSNNSIKRYYAVNPTINGGLNATVVFHYDSRTSELNGLTESTLQLFKSEDNGATWLLGAGTEDATNHKITLAGVDSLSWWTAGSSNSPLPVELTSLTASVSGRDIVLAWKTATEVNVSKFVVQRSLNGKWSTAGEIAAYGNSSSPRSYSFVDKSLAVGKYIYRLKMVDNDGTYEYSSVMATAEVYIPTEFSVAQNYPNPFNPGTMVSFELPNDAQVVIELYAVTGAKLATVESTQMTAGYNSYYLNMNKYNLPSGAYFYKVTATESATGKIHSQTRKMVYMK